MQAIKFLLLAIFGLVTSTYVSAQDPPSRELTTITRVSNTSWHVWVLPTDQDLLIKQLKAEKIPGRVIEELNSIVLSGNFRSNSATTFEDMLRSPKVVSLDVSCLDLRENELTQIAQCPTLRYLCLAEVTLSDAMLEDLGRMDHLKRLNLFETNITNDQLKALQARIPNVTIELEEPKVHYQITIDD